ncbi:glycosyltransferase [Rhodococcus sp. AB351]|uniref:glycosyltransferase n=1 Tax=Rhodococcus sp. AB351 TaxID=3413280 RepID=UPI003C1B440A
MLWVASSGGHFAQLMRIAAASQASPDSDWVTFDTPQTRGALEGRRAHFVDYIAPRDFKNVAKAAQWARTHLKRERYDLCISTGAGLALAVQPVAAMSGIPTVYVESISRVEGPSLTGRILRHVPRVNTYTQHRDWADKDWTWKGSILDSWRPERRLETREPRNVFVTLGTIKPYRFDRAVDAVRSVLRPEDNVVWQLGSTTRDDLPGEVYKETSPEKFRDLALNSDVVVTHAGVGSILELLDAGITPVILVRRKEHDEHVDNHQQQIADAMTSRGLAFELNLDAPSREAFVASASGLAVGNAG